MTPVVFKKREIVSAGSFLSLFSVLNANIPTNIIVSVIGNHLNDICDTSRE